MFYLSKRAMWMRSIWINPDDGSTIEIPGKTHNEILEEHIDKRKSFVKSRKDNLMGTHKTPHMCNHMENENVIDNNNVKQQYNNKKNIKLRRWQEDQFKSIWNDYPNKIGRKRAESSFFGTVLTEEVLIEIKKALVNYKHHLAENKWKHPKDGANWFEDWKDFIEYEEPSTDSPELKRFKASMAELEDK